MFIVGKATLFHWTKRIYWILQPIPSTINGTHIRSLRLLRWHSHVCLIRLLVDLLSLPFWRLPVFPLPDFQHYSRSTAETNSTFQFPRFPSCLANTRLHPFSSSKFSVSRYGALMNIGTTASSRCSCWLFLSVPLSGRLVNQSSQHLFPSDGLIHTTAGENIDRIPDHVCCSVPHPGLPWCQVDGNSDRSATSWRACFNW